MSAALAPVEVAQFVERGYIVQRGLIADQDCEAAVDRVWEFLPPRFQRHRPWTWFGKLSDCDGCKGIRTRRGRYKLRDEVWFEPRWLRMLPHNPRVIAVAEALLGDGWVERPQRIRGIYPIFPVWSLRRAHSKGHVDRHAYQLGVIAYLDTVAPGGGGFTVWPGTHRVVFDQYDTQLGLTPRSTLERTLEQLRQSGAECVEISGQRGDVIFFHHRLVHAAGRNRPARIRQAMLAEFRCRDWEIAAADSELDDCWFYWRGLDRRGAATPSRTPSAAWR